MRTVRALLLLAIVKPRPASAWVENLEQLGSGRFALIDTEKNWDDAFAYCVGKGMRLAHVLSEDDKDDIFDIIDLGSNGVGNDDEVWVGAKCPGEDNACPNNDGKNFRWIDADGSSSRKEDGNTIKLEEGNTGGVYTNWDSDEPNNEGGNEFCVEARGGSKQDWNDQACSNTEYFVCESTKYAVSPGGDTKSWSDAKSKCEDEGLQLARIYSAEDHKTVKKLLDKGKLRGASAWIGA
jgi:hypothetical protein